MIIFENAGEIDPTAMTTFGVSVKVGENPIGFFGTGLKYAIAVLLRTGHRITVFSGEDEMRFSTRRANVRGKDFEFVDMSLNDGPQQPVGFTTDLGKTWQPWMAYRELYCNTRDEGGEVYAAHAPSAMNDPRRDLTQIRVEGDDIDRVHTEHAQYFLDGEPDLTINKVGIYRRPSDVLFYRGVRVLKLPKPAIFTYNLLHQVDLTEDRTMAHPFMATYYLAKALGQCQEPEILEAALTASTDNLEFGFDYNSYGEKPSEQFLSVVGHLASVGDGKKVVPSAFGVWSTARPQEFVPKIAALTFDQRHLWDETVRRLKAIGLLGVEVAAVDNIPDGGRSLVSGGKLYIATSVICGECELLRLMIEQMAEAMSGDLCDPVGVLADALTEIGMRL